MRLVTKTNEQLLKLPARCHTINLELVWGPAVALHIGSYLVFFSFSSSPGWMCAGKAEKIGSEPADQDPPQEIWLRGSTCPQLDQSDRYIHRPHTAVRPWCGMWIQYDKCPHLNMKSSIMHHQGVLLSAGRKNSEHNHKHLVQTGG